MSRVVAFLAASALVLAGCDRGAGEGAQETAANAVPSEAAGKALAEEVDRSLAGTALPPLQFTDPEGNVLDLGTVEGPVLINLWATWCAPCVVEMPALDELASVMEGEVRVLTISQDLRGAEVVGPFFAARDFANLEQWLDPDNTLTEALADGGALPVTVLFDAEGREILRVSGGYEWDSEEAIALVSEALAEADSAS